MSFGGGAIGRALRAAMNPDEPSSYQEYLNSKQYEDLQSTMQQAEELTAKMDALPDGSPERERLRDRLMRQYRIARMYTLKLGSFVLDLIFPVWPGSNNE